MDKMKPISEAIVQLKWDEIAVLTNEAVEAGIPALEIINQGLVSGDDSDRHQVQKWRDVLT